MNEELNALFQRLCSVNERLSHYDKATAEVAEVAEIISALCRLREKCEGKVLLAPSTNPLSWPVGGWHADIPFVVANGYGETEAAAIADLQQRLDRR